MNQLKKLFAVAALTACVLPVAAQYPVIPDSVKIRGEEQQKEMLVINQSFKGVENEIVRMKYIEGLTLEEIVEETGYSDSYIRKKHAEIRSKLQFIDDYEARHLDRKAKKEELEYYDEKRRKTQQLSLF